MRIIANYEHFADQSCLNKTIEDRQSRLSTRLGTVRPLVIDRNGTEMAHPNQSHILGKKVNGQSTGAAPNPEQLIPFNDEDVSATFLCK